MTERSSWAVPIGGPDAWVISTFLKRDNVFVAWLDGVRQQLSPEEFGAVMAALQNLKAKGDEYRELRVSWGETAKPIFAEPAARSIQHATVADAARELDVSEVMVRKYCRDEKLAAIPGRRGWEIDRASLDIFKARAAA